VAKQVSMRWKRLRRLLTDNPGRFAGGSAVRDPSGLLAVERETLAEARRVRNDGSHRAAGALRNDGAHRAAAALRDDGGHRAAGEVRDDGSLPTAGERSGGEPR
jgi:hypothetical protein